MKAIQKYNEYGAAKTSVKLQVEPATAQTLYGFKVSGLHVVVTEL